MADAIITSELLVAQERVVLVDQEREDAIQRRALTFALAHERGVSAGEIARLTGATPQEAYHAVRIGRGLLRARRARRRRLEIATA